MKKIYLFLSLLTILSFSSCTEQIRTRTFGGTMVIDVPSGYKVTSATWKETDLFYFMEPVEEGYVPKDKMFIESSSYGMLESKIIFKEKR